MATDIIGKEGAVRFWLLDSKKVPGLSHAHRTEFFLRGMLRMAPVLLFLMSLAALNACEYFAFDGKTKICTIGASPFGLYIEHCGEIILKGPAKQCS